MEQAREGNEGLHARPHAGPFHVWRGFAGKEQKVPRLALAAQARRGRALGMTGFWWYLGTCYDLTSSVLRCWRSSWRNSSWLRESARFSRPSNRSSGSSVAWLLR